ncbi:radical SAM protein [Candidatus Woesearchaeota archaeon]|nr:radical SAM protein [Candidatus Woesearchaeota archaeon]
MAEITFETLTFREIPEGVDVTFQRMFGFKILKEELITIGEYKAEKNKIIFSAPEKVVQRKFSLILQKHFTYLKNKMNGKETVYVHKNSGIPLLGSIAFGIIDRNTSIIEVRAITSCNIKCNYCSVNEDIRPTDFIVEADYLAEEFQKIAKYKNTEFVDCHINSQGEPFLYFDMVRLVKRIAETPNIREITVNTNGTLLTSENIKALAEAGLTRINLSLNAIDEKKASVIAGCPYPIMHVLKMAEEVTKHMELLIAPVLVPGYNEEEMDKIIEFAKTLKNPNGKMPVIGIQNFLFYKFGRNPSKSMPWEDFYSLLKKLEEKHGVKLIVSKEDFQVTKTKELPSPMKKGEVVRAKVISSGRLYNETLCVAKERCISVIHPYTKELRGKNIKIKIIKDKHNLFVGEKA